MGNILTHIMDHVFECILVLVAAIAIVKIAKIEKRSRWLWGGLTFALCFASTYMSYLPYMRILIIAVLVFVLMMVCNIFRQH